MIAAIFLSLPARGSTPTDRVIPLGKIGGWQVRAVVTIAPQTPEEAGACEVKVRYLLQAGGKRLLTNVMDAGEGYRGEICIAAADFTGSGSKQLLVSTKLGGVHSHVYDLSGTHLRTLYSLEGRYVAGNNYIARRLPWNGNAFVPYHPGPSREDACRLIRCIAIPHHRAGKDRSDARAQPLQKAKDDQHRERNTRCATGTCQDEANDPRQQYRSPPQPVRERSTDKLTQSISQ